MPKKYQTNYKLLLFFAKPNLLKLICSDFLESLFRPQTMEHRTLGTCVLSVLLFCSHEK